MLIKAAECKCCGDVVFSRTPDDCRKCTCGSVEVSGGDKYFKHFGIPGADYEIKKIYINISLDRLYDDWYDMSDDYGLIKPEENNTNRSENGVV